MVQIQKAERKTVYRYLLNEGVIVIHKDFSNAPHKGTEVPNIQVWMLLRSLKDRGFVQLVFNWQHYYYFLNGEGKKYLSQYLGLTEQVDPLTWKKNQRRDYEIFDDAGRGKRPRKEREGGQQPKGGRGGRDRGDRGDRGAKNTDAPTQQKPTQVPAEK